ncbi:MAG: TetR/AcrR family transcriptional regulator [Ignavibacteriaceae bacterium]|nr:TetR/AcrR family transcriptional regulator [Ignavibacteriaceae bacterium]
MEKERKQNILKTAEKRFSRHGFNKTTLNEIARDLRIGKTTIYHYFDTKEELFYKTIEWQIDLYIDELRAIFVNDQQSMNERLAEYFNFKTTIYLKFKLIYEILFYTMKEEVSEKEVLLVRVLFDKEIEFIKQFLPGKKDQLNETAYTIVLRSWGEMFSNKIKSATNPDKILAKDNIIRYISSFNL